MPTSHVSRFVQHHCFQFRLQPGDVAWMNNYTILHGRNEFTDGEEASRQRHLMRLWLDVPNGRPVVPEIRIYENRDGRSGIDPQPGRTPASIHRFYVFVKNATSLDPVMGAVARIISTTNGDTLGVITTGIDGTGELSLPCSGAALPYLLEILGPSGRSAILEHRDQPARCGIAERTAITI